MLKQATSNAAEIMAQCNSRNPWIEAPLGVIKEGAWADMLIYAENPLEDIGVVVDYKNQLKVVIKNGVVYEGDTLTEIWPHYRERNWLEGWYTDPQK